MLSGLPRPQRRWPKKPKHPPYRREQTEHPPRDWYDKATLVIAIVGIVVVAVYTCVTTYQAVLMRRQLDAALSQQRAWLKISLEPAEDISIDPQHGLMAAFHLKVTNVGSIPAEAAFGDTSLHILETSGGMHAVPDVSDCFFVRHPRGEVTGATVFPGETVELIMPFVGIGRKDMLRLKSPPTGLLGLIAVSCVTYTYGDRRTEHFTRSTALIRNSKRPFLLFKNLNEDVLPKGSMVIDPSPSDNRAD